MHLKAARTSIEHLLNADIPTFMWGPVGVGKSSLIRDITKDRNWGLIDFRVSTRDPVALMGLPDLSGETTRWKVPDEFPQIERDGPEGILFLDELNAASPSMQAAAFGLVLDRKVGEYVLPDGWRVIGAGNRQSDRAAAQRMPSALANRFAHIDIDPDLDTTVDHFLKIGVSPIISAFLRWRPALLHKMASEDIRAFPTPRSWEQAAKVIGADESVRKWLVAANVGEEAASEIEGFMRVYQDLPTIKSIMADPAGAKVPGEASARYAVSTALGQAVEASNFDRAIAYMKRLPKEFSVIFVMDAVKRDKKLCNTTAYQEWCVENQSILFAA